MNQKAKKEDQKYIEFKENIKSHLNSDDETSISFYVGKWDTLEKSSMYGHWNGKGYEIFADVLLKDAVYEYEDSLNDFYDCLENANSISDLNANDFNLTLLEEWGHKANLKKIEWEEPLTDEEEQDFKNFGGIEEFVRAAGEHGVYLPESIEETVFKTGKIWKLKVTIGDNKYTLERTDPH